MISSERWMIAALCVLLIVGVGAVIILLDGCAPDFDNMRDMQAYCLHSITTPWCW